MGDSGAALSTELMRTSTDPLFVRLRQLLGERGIDVHSDVLADLFPDDVTQEFGVLVTRDHRVFTFIVHLGLRGDLRTQAATAVLADWTDITGQWRSTPYAPSVRDAFAVLPAGRVAP